MLLLLLIAAAHIARAALLPISVVPGTPKFVDSDGRQRIFHGLNVVYKSFPFLPIQVCGVRRCFL